MHIFRIPKRNGKFRTIYAPDKTEMEELRSLLIPLTALAQFEDAHGVAHAFMPGRSPVTNALAHVGDWNYTLKFDLEDFFDHVMPQHFRRLEEAGLHMAVDGSDGSRRVHWRFTVDSGTTHMIPDTVVESMFPDGAARQGLPTSPILANIAAAPMDNDIMRLRTRGRGGQATFVYTRYADDLTFGFNARSLADFLMAKVKEIVERHGFRLNEAKTRLQCARAGRRVVTGIAVDDKRIYPTRETRRRLRAAEHQNQAGIKGRNLARLIQRQRAMARQSRHITIGALQARGAEGLAEWCKLRPPKTAAARKTTAQVARAAPTRPSTARGPQQLHAFGMKARKI